MHSNGRNIEIPVCVRSVLKIRVSYTQMSWDLVQFSLIHLDNSIPCMRMRLNQTTVRPISRYSICIYIYMIRFFYFLIWENGRSLEQRCIHSLSFTTCWTHFSSVVSDVLIYFFLMYMYIHIFTYISTPIFSQEIIFDQTSLSCILHVSAFDFFSFASCFFHSF